MNWKQKIFSSNTAAVDLSLLLMRLTFGGLMMFNHGTGKLEKIQNGPVKFMDFMGLGAETSFALVVFAEFFCSLLIALGVATRLALIPLIITMLVILFKAKQGDPFSEMELPAIYLMAYVVMLISGPGKYSVDRLISK